MSEAVGLITSGELSWGTPPRWPSLYRGRRTQCKPVVLGVLGMGGLPLLAMTAYVVMGESSVACSDLP